MANDRWLSRVTITLRCGDLIKRHTEAIGEQSRKVERPASPRSREVKASSGFRIRTRPRRRTRRAAPTKYCMATSCSPSSTILSMLFWERRISQYA
ncbi:hypothetical protein SISSUDRAFT_136654 [Sistotremastrum suecicum HHB10207 ss-3]|uniref:Uncharacterized protein n=1 Tax=Sistotremastrum suecicum HHB10207 ss-3 TaxID=1314776 RepID=A0A166AU94_9AGAM|nr:hypothetical protein SISSUDRAFT_136654 [Sistotremastrum suecicum HHB10207 ss-3]